MGFWNDFGRGFKMGFNAPLQIAKPFAPVMALTGPQGMAAAAAVTAIPTLHRGGYNNRTRVVRLKKGERVTSVKRKGKKPGPKKGSHNKRKCKGGKGCKCKGRKK